MKVKFKRKEVVEFNELLKVCLEEEKDLPFKVTYAVKKNQPLFEQEAKLIIETMKPNAEYMEYDVKRVNIAKELCEKNEAGAIIHNNQFQFSPENKIEFQKKVEELQAEYKPVIDEQNTKQTTFLEEEIELECYCLPMSAAPEKTNEHLGQVLFKLIVE
jgi:hypothetical protein